MASNASADVQDAAPDFRVDVERIEAVGPDRVLAFERGETEVLIAEVPVGNWYERGVRIIPEGVGK